MRLYDVVTQPRTHFRFNSRTKEHRKRIRSRTACESPTLPADGASTV
ncbi:unnamed protein product [Cylicostephanus goldi]|uniref:Uncharacterized protein n=1 Tax=Cylicostephanus goldi TaxID=71465 RepID=A0A3P6RDN9_CYLGO|nr:unnamed protein product [Cylicostephanus goldi]